MSNTARDDDPINPLQASHDLQTANELLLAEVTLLRAELDARDKADAARNAIVVKRYLKLKDCARVAGVDYRTGWSWHKNRAINGLDSYVIPGTSTIMCEVNDMIAMRTRSGRHAARSFAKLVRS